MTNEELVALLRRSIEQWNAWRKNNPTIHPDLSGTDLSNVDLSHADLSETNLSNADLSNTTLYATDLSITELSNAKLSNANLCYSNLIGANLSNADLSNADLTGTNFGGANLSGANLSGANLMFINLNEADLRGTNLTHAVMDGTSIGDRDLRVVHGLETIYHEGPSPLSINTIYLSQGNIPEEFIRGTGVPNEFLEYIKTLTNKPFEYYSCFISYSHHDEAFAKRLHTDLRENNVQSWFAPHDIRIGDEFRSRIEESIRKHDKVLLVLSRHSINSTWVQKEVETAFEKEQKRKRPVLFPIKLDESVIRTKKSWAADIRRMRHIGDFQRWKEHDEYQQAFTRLLRDLKAESNT
jgi:hypothetical protein